MKDSTAGDVIMGFVLMGFGALLGGVLVGNIVGSGWEKEAIKHGAAEYSQQTGKWQWKVTPQDAKASRAHEAAPVGWLMNQ